MSTINLHSLMETLNREDILICFSGPFSHSIIEELGTAVKRYLEAEQVTRTSMMSVFSIFIEQTQNVRNYATTMTGRKGSGPAFGNGIVVIGKANDHYLVSSGNFIARADAPPLIARLERLRTLDREGLKIAYKEQLRANLPAGSGAGLGLLQMARTASSPLDYSLKEIDGQLAFFSLKATI